MKDPGKPGWLWHTVIPPSPGQRQASVLFASYAVLWALSQERAADANTKSLFAGREAVARLPFLLLFLERA